MTGRNRRPKAIIIGASGFIGSSLTKMLFEKCHSVTAVIGEHGLKYLEDVQDKRIKVYSYKEVENNFRKLGRFRFLFNLSGYIDIGESFIEPLKYEMNKPITTIKLIEDCQTEKFINISTANVYNFAYNPLSERSPLGPVSPYAISQLSADYYTQVLCGYHKIPYLILRLFNPYGPPNTKRGVIASIINRLLEGGIVSLHNHHRKFDFTYIDDIVEAMIFCAAKLRGIINIGCSRPVSLLKVYKKISFLLCKNYKEPRIIISDKHREEVFSNSNKLKRNGFKFKYSINEGLKQTVKYFQESNNRV